MYTFKEDTLVRGQGTLVIDCFTVIATLDTKTYPLKRHFVPGLISSGHLRVHDERDRYILHHVGAQQCKLQKKNHKSVVFCLRSEILTESNLKGPPTWEFSSHIFSHI